MASSDNLYASITKSNGKKSSPLTTLVSISNPTPPVTIPQSPEAIDEVNQPFLKNRRPTKVVLMGDVSHRLSKRKLLHNRLYIINNVMCFLGLFGIIFMIVENEISFMDIYHKQTTLSWFIKTTITCTTITLIGLVFYYNRLNLSLYAVNNSLNNWRVGLTLNNIFLIFLEVVLCMLHPFPRHFPFIQNIKSNNSTVTNPISPYHIDIDVALGLPMFARLCLLCRVILFHSHLVHNASSQSLGYLNRVSINFMFLIKTYLEQWPTRCLLVFSAVLFFIGSWSLRACNYNSLGEHLSILDSMWLFIVTFTTVGYGDLTPSTYCGRGIAGMIGLLGILSTALIISVLAQKLVLSRSEKYVHNFVSNIELAKERKNQAANVVKFTLKIWYLKKKCRPTSNEYIKTERRLFRSIHYHQQLKQEQKNLIDSCIGFPELITIQRESHVKTRDNIKRSVMMQSKIDKMEGRLVDMDQRMLDIQNTLNIILNKMSQ